jgi:hypothetical protein
LRLNQHTLGWLPTPDGCAEAEIQQLDSSRRVSHKTGQEPVMKCWDPCTMALAWGTLIGNNQAGIRTAELISCLREKKVLLRIPRGLIFEQKFAEAGAFV